MWRYLRVASYISSVSVVFDKLPMLASPIIWVTYRRLLQKSNSSCQLNLSQSPWEILDLKQYARSKTLWRNTFWVQTFDQLFLGRESRGLKPMGVSKTWTAIVANQDPRELASDGPKPSHLVNVSCRSIQVVHLLYLVVVLGNMWLENWNMLETATDNLVFDSKLKES